MSFSSLPLDILPAVAQELDAVDFVRLKMVCKGLYRAAQCRQVWVNQLEKLHREDPVLKPATPPLASLSTEDLKRFVISRMKLRRRFNDGNKNLGFAAKGVTEIPGRCNLKLLPGGRFLLTIDDDGGEMTLHRVRVEDSQVALPVVANVGLGGRRVCGLFGNKLLITMSPCPVLIYFRGNRVSSTFWVININHHEGTMSLGTTFQLPNGGGHHGIDGQGRVLGFLGVIFPGRVTFIHLDYPGVTVEAEIPPTYGHTAGGQICRWEISMPAENLAIIYSAEHILACKIPNFLGLSPGTHLTGMRPMWSWPDVGHPNERSSDFIPYSETVYDPRSAQAFDLYYVHKSISQVITVTVPINTGDGHSHVSELGGLPALKQEFAVVKENRNGTVATYNCSTKGLHVRRLPGDGITYMVVPLKNLALGSQGNALWMTVPCNEFEKGQRMDVDEATGRVVFWGRDADAKETTVFVGSLV